MLLSYPCFSLEWKSSACKAILKKETVIPNPSFALEGATEMIVRRARRKTAGSKELKGLSIKVVRARFMGTLLCELLIA